LDKLALNEVMKKLFKTTENGAITWIGKVIFFGGFFS